MSVEERLIMELHGEGEGVEHDGHEHRVLADGRRGECPQLVLKWIFWNVPPDWLGI